MTYFQMKQKHQKQFNEFSDDCVFWAFSSEQFEAGKKRLNCKNADLLNIGGGGYISKNKYQEWKMISEAQEQEKRELMSNDDFFINAIVYELGNYEYCITGSLTEVKEALDIDLADERVRTLTDKAITQYLEYFREKEQEAK